LEGVAAAGSGAGAAAGAGVASFGVEVSGFGAQDANVRRMSARKGKVIRLINDLLGEYNKRPDSIVCSRDDLPQPGRLKSGAI
jgi:hypothetical protein